MPDISVGDRTTLNQRYSSLRGNFANVFPHLDDAKPVYRDFRSGDMRHSLADIRKAATLLGYQATHRVGEYLKVAMGWYVQQFTKTAVQSGIQRMLCCWCLRHIIMTQRIIFAITMNLSQQPVQPIIRSKSCKHKRLN